MKENNDSTFDDYKDLYELTRRTADEHIEFYRNKASLSEESLFAIWKKLSKQAETFDSRNWSENWHNWHKNLHAFEKHKFEAKFLIQHYLSDVLEELLSKIIHNFSDKSLLIEKQAGTKKQIQNVELSGLIKKEVKRQVKLEFTKFTHKLKQG